MRAASTVVLVGLGIGLAAQPAAALDTLPFCDNVKDANERMECLQAHISHLEESILGLSTQIADLNRQLRDKPDMETPYKLLFMNGKCLGQDDNVPSWVSCTDPDSLSLMDRSKTGLKKKPEAAAPVIDPQQAKKEKKAKDKAAAAAAAGGGAQPGKPPAANAPGQPPAGKASGQSPPANAPGQSVPKSSP